MKKNIKTAIPKFFCENCGNEVKRNTKICPHCGKFFASVRCPECNYLGTTDEFINGCPDCGYAFTPSNALKKNNGNKNKDLSAYKSNRYDDPLPWWIYSLIAGLAGLLFIFFFKLR